MNAFSIENPDKVNLFLSTMATQFRDKQMMQILQAAEKFPTMKRVTTTLRLQKAEEVFATGVSPDKAFTMVALDSVGDSVLGSPVLTRWMTYADDFNKKNPGKEESWFTTRRVNYQEEKLDNVIETARKSPKTSNLADMVEKARMDDWLTNWRHEPESVFRS